MLIAHQPARLGNKLFTLATTISKAIDMNIDYRLKEEWKLNLFINNPILVADNCKYNEYYENEDTDLFKYADFTVSPNTVLNGYFQTENYFKHNSQKIKEILKCKFESKIKDYYKNILSHKHTISIHIRRGDYLTDKKFPVLPTSYYTNAISLMIEKIKDDDFLFLIFSDDIEFCKKEFGYHPKFCYVEESDEILSLYLMSYCSHNIIANSSFSWWGAWLNENPNKIVICPTQTRLFNIYKINDYPEYLPNEWIQINFEEKELRENKKMDFVLENLIKFLSVFKIKDELNLTSLPNIFSYTDSPDLLISNNIDDKVKYVITLNKPKNKRFLVFGKYYLIDNFPQIQKDLFIRVINMDSRADRWDHSFPRCRGLIKENEISTLTNGEVGCVKSHLYCLFLSWLYNYKQALIFEDDVELSIDFTNQLNLVRQKLQNTNYDICKLSSINFFFKFNKKIILDTIYKGLNSSGAHTYLVTNIFNYLNVLLSFKYPADDSFKYINYAEYFPYLTIAKISKSDIFEFTNEDFNNLKLQVRYVCIDRYFIDSFFHLIPNVNNVLHVGANMCQERWSYKSLFPQRIVWIEANPEIKVDIPDYYHLVASDVEEEIDFHITNFNQSSSLLKLKEHLIEHPWVQPEKTIRVKTQRLDNFLPTINVTDFDLIAIDVQGAELKVLKGLGDLLLKNKYLILEVNIKELYENTVLLPELDLFLKDYDRVMTKMTCHGWGDALYVRR